MNEDIKRIADRINALERSAKRTLRLADELHSDLADMLEEHGPGAGVSPSVVAPKEPPK
jgi:hypothetical protein